MLLHLRDIKICEQQSAVPRGIVLVQTSRSAVIKDTTQHDNLGGKKNVFHFRVFQTICFTISIITEMMNTFPITVSVLDKTSKDPLKELTAKSFKVSQAFFFNCKDKL